MFDKVNKPCYDRYHSMSGIYYFRRGFIMNNKTSIDEQMKQLRELRKLAGMNRREFSDYMGIPLRTIEEWEAGRRKMPDYVLRLISYRVRIEKVLYENMIEMEDYYGE